MTTTLGNLVADLYESFLLETGDPEVAAVATAAAVNDLLCEAARRDADARWVPPDAASEAYATV